MGFREQCRRIWRFISVDVWDVELTSLSLLTSLGVQALRVVNLVVRGFRTDKCPLHASALTFSTLMSLVPMLALSLALARGLGDTNRARDLISGAVRKWTEGVRTEAVQPVVPPADASDRSSVNPSADPAEAAAPAELPAAAFAAEIDRVVDRVFEKVENVNFRALGGMGLIFLLFMVVQVLGQVESSFNQVWGVTSGRSIWRKITDYLVLVLVLPFLITAASSLPIADLATRFVNEATAARIQAFLGSMFLKNLLVILMTTLCFVFVIICMPNTRVRLRPAFCGGLVAALLFMLWMKVCAHIQVAAFVRYGKIYGTFAVVPIILLWLYVSWNIVLFGAEVSFAVQNCATYRMERGAYNASVQSRVLLALSVVTEAGRAMLTGTGGFDAATYARERKIPVRFLNEVIRDLREQGFMGELSEKDQRFVLLRPPGNLPVSQVVDAIFQRGVKPDGLGLQALEERIREAAGKVEKGIHDSLQTLTIRDLIGEVPA